MLSVRTPLIITFLWHCCLFDFYYYSSSYGSSTSSGRLYVLASSSSSGRSIAHYPSSSSLCSFLPSVKSSKTSKIRNNPRTSYHHVNRQKQAYREQPSSHLWSLHDNNNPMNNDNDATKNITQSWWKTVTRSFSPCSLCRSVTPPKARRRTMEQICSVVVLLLFLDVISRGFTKSISAAAAATMENPLAATTGAAATALLPSRLGIRNILVAGSLVTMIGSMGLSRIFGMKSLAQDLYVACLRCSVQVFLLGAFVLQRILLPTNHVWLLLLWILGVGSVAAKESYSRVQYTYPKLQTRILKSVLLGTVSILSCAFLFRILGVGLFLSSSSAFTRTLIPVAGMLFGNTLSAVSLCTSTLTKELYEQVNQIELRLAFGAKLSNHKNTYEKNNIRQGINDDDDDDDNNNEALAPIIQSSIRNGLIPTINAVAVTGIVHIPGMMTGQILAGQTPTQAAIYQICINFLIASTACTTVQLLIHFISQDLVDSQNHRLYHHRLVPKQQSNSNNDNDNNRGDQNSIEKQKQQREQPIMMTTKTNATASTTGKIKTTLQSLLYEQPRAILKRILGQSNPTVIKAVNSDDSIIRDNRKEKQQQQQQKQKQKEMTRRSPKTVTLLNKSSLKQKENKGEDDEILNQSNKSRLYPDESEGIEQEQKQELQRDSEMMDKNVNESEAGHEPEVKNGSSRLYKSRHYTQQLQQHIQQKEVKKEKEMMNNKKSCSPILSVQNLWIDRAQINLSLNVHAGDRIGITGPSGIGKSQILRTLAQLEELCFRDPLIQDKLYSNNNGANNNMSRGHLSFYNTSVTDYLVPYWRTKICYVPQDKPNLPGTPQMFYEEVCQYQSRSWNGARQPDKRTRTLNKNKKRTPIEILSHWNNNALHPSHNDDDDENNSDDDDDPKEKAAAAKALFHQSWFTLSGGEAQRVLLAIAVSLEPDVLLLDEFTSSLDQETSQKVEKTLQDPQHNIPAIVFVTHSMEQLHRFGTHHVSLS